MLKICQYNRLGEMPEPIYRACKAMGFVDGGYLRDVIRTHEHRTRLIPLYYRSAYVMELDGKVIGWACMYVNDSPRKRRIVSVWIQTRYRGRGYGKVLIRYIRPNWNRYKPQMQSHLKKMWDSA